MNQDLYRIIVTGNFRHGIARSSVIIGLAKLFNIDLQKAEALISGGNNTIKKDLSQAQAVKYKNAIEKTGLLCRIEKQAIVSKDVLTESSTLICPKCNYAAPPGTFPQENGSCPKCGVIIQNYLKRLNERPELKQAIPSVQSAAAIDASQHNVSELLPLRFIKGIKWGAMIIGVIIFFWTGISVFETPTYEVIYRLNDPRRICQHDPQIKHYPELLGMIAETGRLDWCPEAWIRWLTIPPP